MIERSAHTEFRPKWYRPRLSIYWWLSRWSYVKFMLRELSSVFVAYFIVITLLQVRALTLGPSSYARLQDWLGNPLVILLNIVGLLFLHGVLSGFWCVLRTVPIRSGLHDLMQLCATLRKLQRFVGMGSSVFQSVLEISAEVGEVRPSEFERCRPANSPSHRKHGTSSSGWEAERISRG